MNEYTRDDRERLAGISYIVEEVLCPALDDVREKLRVFVHNTLSDSMAVQGGNQTHKAEKANEFDRICELLASVSEHFQQKMEVKDGAEKGGENEDEQDDIRYDE